MEAATGVFTGSVYRAKTILAAGHLGEARHYSDGSTLLQKTHQRAVGSQGGSCAHRWRREHIKCFAGRAVVLVRNPYQG